MFYLVNLDVRQSRRVNDRASIVKRKKDFAIRCSEILANRSVSRLGNLSLARFTILELSLVCLDCLTSKLTK